ncbi:hypothetical protein Q3G72_007574 [Acer saccharum]|nr:hypothetical protein Q3G72_007574 [Acer saccharum]
MRMVAGKRCFEDDELDLEITKGKLDDLVEMFGPIVTVALGDYFPFLRWLTYYGEERRLLKIHKRKDTFIQALLDAHQNTTSSFTSVDDRKTSQTIIDVMLKLKESEPEFYTTYAIKGMIQAMLIAGTHTTATTMERVVSDLISHPDVLQNARDEIDNHVGNSRLINDTDLTELPYLHCIINETLRLSPGGVLPPRESSEDCIVGGYHIPRGTQLLVNTMVVHRDPELWKEPDRYMPERFLESEEGKERFKYIAFGIGRRICPGEGLGMRVMALSLGTLIQCFDLEEATDESQGKRYFEDDVLDLEITEGKVDDLLEMFDPIAPVALGDYFPFLRWLTYYGVERRQLKIHKRKDEFIQALIDAHQNTTSSFTSVDDRKTSQTIIDVMLKLKESEPEFCTNDLIKGTIQNHEIPHLRTCWAINPMRLGYPQLPPTGVRSDDDDSLNQDPEHHHHLRKRNLWQCIAYGLPQVHHY